MGIGKFGQDGDPGVPTPAPDPQAHDKLGNELLNMVNQPTPIPAAFVPPTGTPDVMKKIKEFEAQQLAAREAAAASATGTEAMVVPADQVPRDPNEPARASFMAVEAAVPLDDDEEPYDFGVGDKPDPKFREHLKHVWSRLGPFSDQYACNELGSSERFALYYRWLVMYCTDLKQWYVWHQGHGIWEEDVDAMRVTFLAGQMLRSLGSDIRKNVTLAKNPETKKVVVTSGIPEGCNPLIPWGEMIDTRLGHFAKAQNRAPLENIVKLARVHMAVRAEDLDADPYAFTVANGTLDLSNGAPVLKPFDPDQLITKRARVLYDPEAKCLVWDSFVAQTCAGDLETPEGPVPKGPELAAFLAEAFGVSLTGDVSDKGLFLAYGGKDTGKSTLFEAVEGVTGDYAMHSNIDAFLAKTNVGGPSQGIAKLKGARFVHCEEVDTQKQLSSATIKSLVSGGSTITARFMRENDISFKPQCKLWLACNDRPGVEYTDGAMWRRLHIIPMDNTVPLEDQDSTLRGQFKQPEARSAILNWALAGWARRHARGHLEAPACVKAAGTAYKVSQDKLHEFLEERCIIEEQAATMSRPLFEAYSKWASGADACLTGNASDRVAADPHPLGPKNFAQKMSAREGVTKCRVRNGTCFQGVGLLRSTAGYGRPAAADGAPPRAGSAE